MGNSNSQHGEDSSRKPSAMLQRSLQYTLSADEYAFLYRRLLKKLPSAGPSRLPTPASYSNLLRDRNDFNAATFRASVRVFLTVQAALGLYEFLKTKLLRSGRPQRTAAKAPFWKSPNFRLSLSAGLLLFFHRLLHRFLTRLRLNLLTKNAAPFRKRNPRISKILTSKLAPAIGAGVAGYALALSPAGEVRLAIAIYVATRAAEFGYNALEADGWFKNRPWWFGSWMLMPPVFGQLLHAFVFDRDCFPKAYGDFIMGYTPVYIQRRPKDLPAHLPWPSNDEIVDTLATMSRTRFPPFVSPILFPDSKNTLPSALEKISPITSSAHPSITFLSCALLHPSEPSCLRTHLEYYLRSIPALARFFTIVFSLFALPRYKKYLANPSKEFNRLAKFILAATTSISASIGTSWGMICLFQSILPRSVLPTQRWFWGGFISGFWAFLLQDQGRAQFLYSFRMSLESMWKLGVKKGYWRPGRTGDVWLGVAGVMLLNAVYDHNPDAFSSNIFRRGLKMTRGDFEETPPPKTEPEKAR